MTVGVDRAPGWRPNSTPTSDLISPGPEPPKLPLGWRCLSARARLEVDCETRTVDRNNDFDGDDVIGGGHGARNSSGC